MLDVSRKPIKQEVAHSASLAVMCMTLLMSLKKKQMVIVLQHENNRKLVERFWCS